MKKLLHLSLMTSIFGASLLLCNHNLMKLNLVKTLSQVISGHHAALTLWRYGLYALAFIVWPYFIKHIGTRKKWRIADIVYLSKQRFKLLGLLVIIELLFGYNLLKHLIDWL